MPKLYEILECEDQKEGMNAKDLSNKLTNLDPSIIAQYPSLTSIISSVTIIKTAIESVEAAKNAIQAMSAAISEASAATAAVGVTAASDAPLYAQHLVGKAADQTVNTQKDLEKTAVQTLLNQDI